MTRALSSIVAALCLLGCQPDAPDPAPSSARGPGANPMIERPTIEFAGCRHVEPGRCFVRAQTEAELRVWIDVQPKAELRVELDGLTLAPRRAAVDGGVRLHLPIPADAGALTITGLAPRWTEPFSLALVHEPVPEAVTAAHAEALAGRVDAALARLDAAMPTLDPLGQLAAMQQRRRMLGMDRARAEAEAAAALAEQLGRRRDYADCAAGAGLMALISGDLVGAREWTRALAQTAAELPEARVWSLYYGGALASYTGDLNAAVHQLEQASRLARRLDMSRELLSIDEQLATTLAELGRADEALKAARALLEQVGDPRIRCGDRARALGNVAWINLLLAEAGLDHDPPRPLLEDQLAAVDIDGECPDPATAARINLAIVAIAEAEPEEAWAWLEQQRELGVPAYLRAWVDELQAQVGLATGRWSLLPPLVQRADPGGSEQGLRWLALVRHAQTLDALGFGDAALAGYGEAEAVLEQTFASVGVDVGRELFLSGRRASAEGLVDLLVRRGEIEEAHCRARIARRRSLQTVDRVARLAALSPEQRARRDELLFEVLATRDAIAAERRDDWEFSAAEREHRERRRAERLAEADAKLDEALRLVGGDELGSGCATLPSLAPGELSLLPFPRPDGGAWLFVADADGVDVHAVPERERSDDEAWARALLEPIAPRLRAAQRIRVLPTASAWTVPFHALPFDGGVLLDVAPVVYALDLPARPRAQPQPGSRTAVVVADPSNNLPAAREEAARVAERLAAAGWEVRHQADAEVTRARLSESLADAELLHYAGHGSHGGVDGWGGVLLLHDGDQLAVSDILVLPRVPELVVLSGCDTATVDRETLGGGMNLGRAFVLAGAAWVIAADGVVDDALASALGSALYDEAVATDAGFDGARALQRAQLGLRATHPAGWQSFRVVVP